MTQLLVHGGTVLTQDPVRPAAAAMLVESGAVVAIGGEDEVRAAARSDAASLDLDGRVVCPGFIDAHNHFVFSILAELGVDCRTPPVSSVRELLEKLAEVVARTPDGDWVRGWGYSEFELAEGRHPTLAELDRIAPSNPLVIEHTSGHMSVANSIALAAGGITQSSSDPAGGMIVRHPITRRLTGLLHEQASELVDVVARNAVLTADPDACLHAAHTVAARFAALGLTTICDPCVPAEVQPLYQALSADPEFGLRLVGLGMGEAGKFSPPVDLLGRGAEDRPDGFALSGIKFFADGGEQCGVCMSLGGALRGALRSAANAIRYRSLMAARLFAAPRTRLGADGNLHAGIRFYPDDQLATLLQRTVGEGLTAAVHAMGNEAIDQVLGAVEQARRHGPDDARFRMEHVMMPAEGSLSRIADLGVAGVVQPIFVHDYGFPLLLTGMNREFRTLAFRDLIDQGVLLAGSSDAPVSDPAVLPAVEAAVTRRTAHGEVLDADQALTVEEALALYTRNAAAVLGLGPDHGSLRTGSVADFVVLDADPRTVEPSAIGRIQVEETYREGRRVHVRSAGATGTLRVSD
ncbi:MAG TPA: amidohydrolase [Nocardioidaceae bacterium]|nr:amidohydrolase [Nocardioidaceae bacterium]